MAIDHDAFKPPGEAFDPGVDDDDLDIDADPSETTTPSVGVILGAALMLVGVLLVTIAMVGPREKTVTAGGVTTTEPSALAPDIGVGTTAPITEGLGVGFAPVQAGRAALRGFGDATISVTTEDGTICRLCVLSASTVEQRARGLMEVTDPTIGGYDGMLFEYPEEIEGAFWMRNTPLPLSIAYFDEKGNLVSATDMAPCEDSEDCPSYPATGAFRFALEVPQGVLDDKGIGEGAVLLVERRGCPF